MCVCDIVAALALTQPKISFHLAILKNAGLIKGRRGGKWIHYRLSDSDTFRRFILNSVIEKISAESVKEDMRRLDNSLKLKSNKKILPLSERGRSRIAAGDKVKK